MTSLFNIRRKVTSLKRGLVGKQVYENFGEKEQRELDDYIGDFCDYPYEDKLIIIGIYNDFSKWCQTYDLAPPVVKKEWNEKKHTEKVLRLATEIRWDLDEGDHTRHQCSCGYRSTRGPKCYMCLIKEFMNERN